MKLLRNLTLYLSSSLVMGGCIIGPNYHQPEMEIPAEYENQSTYNPIGVKPDPQLAPNIDLERWWETLDDPVLTGLVIAAIENNLDIKIAISRVREARSELEYTIGGLLPQVGGVFSARRLRTGVGSVTTGSNNPGSSGSGSNGSSSTPQGSIASGKPVTIYQENFDSSWEFNIFGIGRAVESVQASLDAQEDSARSVLITLIAEVAQNYTSLRGLQNQREIALKNLAAQKDTLEIQELKVKAGTANELSIAQAQGLYSSTEATIPPLDQKIAQAAHRIAVLVGRNPTDLEGMLYPEGPLPHGPLADVVVPVGLPSELLRRRPDIQQAEHQLHASTANVGVAISDLFPRFSITGALGYQGLHLHSLGQSANDYWNLAGAVNLPIFDVERWAQVGIANAEQEQAVYTYKQTVLNGLSEVEDNLVALNKEQARREMLKHSAEANQKAFDLASQLYQAGIIEFLNVINAQQALFQSQDQLSQSDQLVSINLIALYKSLGGGWETVDLEKIDR